VIGTPSGLTFVDPGGDRIETPLESFYVERSEGGIRDLVVGEGFVQLLIGDHVITYSTEKFER